MPTNFSMTRDVNGYNGFGLPFSIQKYSANLPQDIDTTVAVPLQNPMGSTSSTYSNKYIAIFEYEPGASVFVANNQTAQVPAGSSFALTTSDMNPAARYVSAGDTLHFYTHDTNAYVTVLFYALF